MTKMKRNLKYSVLEECMYQTTEGFMEVRIQHVTFSKVLKGGETLTHHARIITYADTRKYKLFSLLTNDMESDPNEIIEIYRKRWEIDKTSAFFSLFLLFLSGPCYNKHMPQTKRKVFQCFGERSGRCRALLPML